MLCQDTTRDMGVCISQETDVEGRSRGGYRNHPQRRSSLSQIQQATPLMSTLDEEREPQFTNTFTTMNSSSFLLGDDEQSLNGEFFCSKSVETQQNNHHTRKGADSPQGSFLEGHQRIFDGLFLEQQPKQQIARSNSQRAPVVPRPQHADGVASATPKRGGDFIDDGKKATTFHHPCTLQKMRENNITVVGDTTTKSTPQCW